MVTRGIDLAEGAYWFLPRRPALAPAASGPRPRGQLTALARHSLGDSGTTPSAIIAVIADRGRLAGIDTGATLASSYWDAGSIMAHLYLAGAEAGLACCACSAVDDGALVADLGLDPDRFGHVGTFAVGGTGSAG